MDIHPAIVHFPIALLVASFIFDLIGVVAKDDSFKKAGLYCLLLGLFGAGAAYWTGLEAESVVKHMPDIADALAQHKQAGIMTLVLFGVLLIGRMVLEARPRIRRSGYIVYLLVCLIAVINVLRTGYLGAELVEEHGAAVRPVMMKLGLPHPSSAPKPALPSRPFDSQ